MADGLIASLGSLGRVLAASPAAIERLIGDREVAQRIGAARDVVLAGIREDIVRQRFDLHNLSIRRYVVGLFKGLAHERLHAVFIDAHQRYLSDDCLSEGAAGRLTGSLRRLVTRALDLGAAGVILMHNHPSGDAAPSAADISATRSLAASLAALDVCLADHLVVAGTRITSMRKAGVL